MTRLVVPPVAVLAEMPDSELTTLSVELADAIESCHRTIVQVEERHGDAGRVRAALRVYERASDAIDRIVRSRHGQPPPLVLRAARPVQSFQSAYNALKAVNRLIGLLRDEHEAVSAWLVADSEDAEDAALDRLEAAHALVCEAVALGEAA